MRRARKHLWLVSIAAGAFALGPATGFERALHLLGDHHEHNHDSQQCPVCFVLCSQAGAADLPKPDLIARAEPAVTPPPPITLAAPTTRDACRPLAPRAPPA